MYEYIQRIADTGKALQDIALDMQKELAEIKKDMENLQQTLSNS